MPLRGATLALSLSLSLWAADLVTDVRIALAQGDLSGAERLVTQYRKFGGVTPELAEAVSWLARGALAAKKFDAAESYARQAYELCVKQAKGKLEEDRHLTLGLGAAIEVQGLALAERGERAEAVAYLRGELARYRATSLRARIQKNINLLTLEGKPAPALDTAHWLGQPPPPTAGALRGKPVLLFFWAHWCPDCKQQAAVLARLQREDKELVIVGPTQLYGYAAGGIDAPPAAEEKYIEQVRRQFYGDVAMSVPVSEENFKNFGASTTPTLVLIDRRGIVRLYHPGRMTYEELAPQVARARGLSAAPAKATPGRARASH